MRGNAILTVDLNAIAANWKTLCHAHRGPVAAVVKADGYGLGAVPIAKRLRREGCTHFFVAQLGEAVALTPHLRDATIYVLGGILPGDEAAFVKHDIIPVLNSMDDISRWSQYARLLGRTLPALLHIDTGMARLGLPPEDIGLLTSNSAWLYGISLRYVMTHLACADEPHHPLNAKQRIRFADACARLKAPLRSFANSSGIFLGTDYASDLARPGAALYGINPTPDKPNPMHIPLKLEACVLQVRSIAAGTSVGYNATWEARHTARIATVGVGYADGYPRILSTQASACFNGQMLPMAGRISMDLMTFDATNAPDLVPGSMLELIGPSVPPDLLGQQAGTNGYEILTTLGRRFVRQYIGA